MFATKDYATLIFGLIFVCFFLYNLFLLSSPFSLLPPTTSTHLHSPPYIPVVLLYLIIVSWVRGSQPNGRSCAWHMVYHTKRVVKASNKLADECTKPGIFTGYLCVHQWSLSDHLHFLSRSSVLALQVVLASKRETTCVSVLHTKGTDYITHKVVAKVCRKMIFCVCLPGRRLMRVVVESGQHFLTDPSDPWASWAWVKVFLWPNLLSVNLFFFCFWVRHSKWKWRRLQVKEQPVGNGPNGNSCLLVTASSPRVLVIFWAKTIPTAW